MKNILTMKEKEFLGIDIHKNIIRYSALYKGKWIYGEKMGKEVFLKNNNIKNSEELKELLIEIFSEVHIKKPKVAIVAPNFNLIIKQIPLQGMTSEKEIRDFLFLELGSSISLPFEDPIFDLLILERPNIKKKKDKKIDSSKTTKTIKRNRFAVNSKVPIIISSETLLEKLGEVVKQSGGTLAKVSFSSLEYTKILKNQIRWGENFVLIEIDSGEVTITIFENLTPVYVHYEPYNQSNWQYQEEDKQIIPIITQELEALNNLAKIVNDVIYYFESEISIGSKINAIYIVGGHPSLKKEVYHIIKSSSSLSVSVPRSPLKINDQKRLVPYRFLLASSLALGGEKS